MKNAIVIAIYKASDIYLPCLKPKKIKIFLALSMRKEDTQKDQSKLSQ